MEKYTIEELAQLIGKSPNVVKQWFKELKEIFNYKAHQRVVFNQLDLEIARFISAKREEKWTYKEIFAEVEKRFDLRSEDQTERHAKNRVETETATNWEMDPENLFYKIAQDSEIIQVFKYHSLRVMFLASALAKRVGAYDEDLRIAALLHDIGKVGISKNILLKTEPLSDLEFTIIQSHSHVGNTIVRKKLGLPRAAEFIRDHHERWDGSGYPRRLSGEEITYQGRIIAICDAFDAMTVDHRSYMKNTLSREEAFQELDKGSWTHFDGDLVEKFITMMDEVEIPAYMLKGVNQ